MHVPALPSARALFGLALGLGLALALAPARAGRPLSTDDASTDEPGECHVEAWAEREAGQRTLVVAPACTVAQGLEFSAELERPRPRDGVSVGSQLGVKWVPAWAGLGTPLGPLQFGLAAATAHQRADGGGWQYLGPSALLIASLQPGEALALHANLGWQRSRQAAASSSVLSVAAVWTPGPAGLLFAELQASDRPELDGRPLRTVGGRAWLIPDKLGLDLTAGRESGSSTTRWTLGLGWYGLGR